MKPPGRRSGCCCGQRTVKHSCFPAMFLLEILNKGSIGNSCNISLTNLKQDTQIYRAVIFWRSRSVLTWLKCRWNRGPGKLWRDNTKNPFTLLMCMFKVALLKMLASPKISSNWIRRLSNFHQISNHLQSLVWLSPCPVHTQCLFAPPPCCNSYWRLLWASVTKNTVSTDTGGQPARRDTPNTQ